MDIDTRGKHAPLAVVEGHRRQGLVPWLLGVELAQPIRNALNKFAGMRDWLLGVALPVEYIATASAW